MITFVKDETFYCIFLQMNQLNQSFFDFSAALPMTSFAVGADVFEKALERIDPNSKGRRDPRRDTYDYLLDGNYPEWLEFPVVFHHQKGDPGRKMSDLIGFRYTGNHFLISQRLKDLLERNGITGWKTYPVEVYGLKGELLEGYYGFTVTGRGGLIIHRDSERKQKPICSTQQWDGSDFFRAKPGRYIIVTQRVKDLFLENKITTPEFDTLHLDWEPDNPAADEELRLKQIKDEKARIKEEKRLENSKGLLSWWTNSVGIGEKEARPDFFDDPGAPIVTESLCFGDYSEDITFPVSFHLVKDFELHLGHIISGLSGLVLISEQFKKILEENGLTGWKTYPVKVYNGDERIEGYLGFSVTSKCGYVINEKNKRKRIRSYDTSQWDGSDFFWIFEKKDGEILKGYRNMMVSRKAAKVIKAAGIYSIFENYSIQKWL